jgi:hypothetical protein
MKFFNYKKQVIGEYNSSKKVFLIKVRKQKEKVKEPEGWSVEVGAIDTLDILDCKEVHIIDKNSKCTYITPFENFTKNGIRVTREHGDKILVADKLWQVRPDEGISKN